MAETKIPAHLVELVVAMRWRWPAIALAVCLLVSFALPFAQFAAWVGHDTLTIEIVSTEPINWDTLQFATFHSISQANDAMSSGSSADNGFVPGVSKSDFARSIDLVIMGRTGPYGIEYSYFRPSQLVVEYSPLDRIGAPLERKHVPIPAARGNQTMTVYLP